MPVRTAAALTTGTLVLALYVAAWGVPSWTIALTEMGLGVGAALSTRYALKRLAAPRWVIRLPR